jgi:hypothetical protein
MSLLNRPLTPPTFRTVLRHQASKVTVVTALHAHEGRREG